MIAASGFPQQPSRGGIECPACGHWFSKGKKMAVGLDEAERRLLQAGFRRHDNHKHQGGRRYYLTPCDELLVSEEDALNLLEKLPELYNGRKGKMEK